MDLKNMFFSLHHWFMSLLSSILGKNDAIEDTNLHFLKNDDLEKQIFTKDEIKEAFCLNDEYGEEHKQFVNEFLQTFLGNQESKLLSLCILNKIVEALQKKNYDSFKFHEKKVTISWIDKNDGKNISKNPFSLIYNFILQFIPTNNERFSLKIANLCVEVEPITEKQLVETVETSETNSHDENPATNIEEKALSEGSTSGESIAIRQFKDVKNDVIENLKSIMNRLENALTDPVYVILFKEDWEKEKLTKEKIEEIIAILPRTILSEKFSIVNKKSD